MRRPHVSPGAGSRKKVVKSQYCSFRLICVIISQPLLRSGSWREPRRMALSLYPEASYESVFAAVVDGLAWMQGEATGGRTTGTPTDTDNNRDTHKMRRDHLAAMTASGNG